MKHPRSTKREAYWNTFIKESIMYHYQQPGFWNIG